MLLRDTVLYTKNLGGKENNLIYNVSLNKDKFFFRFRKKKKKKKKKIKEIKKI